MESPLNELVASYLADIKNRKGETPSEIETRAKRITLEHDLVFNQIVTNFDSIEPTLPEEVTNEVPLGVVDGINKVFTTQYSFGSRSTVVTKARLRSMIDDDYIETSINEITFTTAPLVGESILIDYKVSNIIT